MENWCMWQRKYWDIKIIPIVKIFFMNILEQMWRRFLHIILPESFPNVQYVSMRKKSVWSDVICICCRVIWCSDVYFSQRSSSVLSGDITGLKYTRSRMFLNAFCAGPVWYGHTWLGIYYKTWVLVDNAKRSESFPSSWHNAEHAYVPCWNITLLENIQTDISFEIQDFPYRNALKLQSAIYRPCFTSLDVLISRHLLSSLSTWLWYFNTNNYWRWLFSATFCVFHSSLKIVMTPDNVIYQEGRLTSFSLSTFDIYLKDVQWTFKITLCNCFFFIPQHLCLCCDR